MKHKLHQIWSEQETKSKKVWKVQAPNGIITFKSRKLAEAFVKAIEEYKE